MRLIRIVLPLALLALASVVPGEQPSPEPWAYEAAQRLEAMHQAGWLRLADLVRFFAPDVVMDTAFETGVTAEGRADLARWLAFAAGPTLDEVNYGDVYLDASGAVIEEHFVETPAPMLPGDDLAVLDMGAHGLVTRSTHPLAVSPSRSLFSASPREDFREYGEAELEAAEALAAAYLRAWSSADPVAVGALYAPKARLVDSLRQVDLQGRDAIVRHVVRSDATAAPLRQSTIVHGGGAAIYLIWPDGYRSVLRHEFGLFVVYTADDGTGCPGRAVVSLKVSAGVIGEERRFHEIDSVRRCWDTEQIPPAWWTALAPLPPLPEDEVTGTVEVGSQRVEIREGTRDLERLVHWAMERFEAANLPAPRVRSVAFGRKAHYLQCTDDRNGLTIDLGDTDDVYLCLGQTDACTDDACTSFTEGARLLILHELAHAWMDRHVGDTGQQTFIEYMGLEDWYRADLPWAQRAVEQAAQVIAWGLMDEPLATTRLGDVSCARLTGAFQLLTGAMPLQTRCADSAP